MMKPTRNKLQILDADYLPVRAKIIEIAAALDRFDRAEGSSGDDGRNEQLREALAILLQLQADAADMGRAEQVQQLFSRDYEAEWREQYDL